MITTIIITALASVTITLVIGYFIWSGISVRKLKKKVENNEKGIHSNGEWSKIIEESLSEMKTELYDNMEQIEKNIYSDIDDRFQHIDNNISETNQRIDIVYSDIDESANNHTRELDKRFDKVYQQLSELYHNKLNQKQDK